MTSLHEAQRRVAEADRALAEAQHRAARTEIELQRTWLALHFDLRRAALGLAPTPTTDSWQQLVEAKVAAGLSRVEAIQQAAHERPDLYAQLGDATIPTEQRDIPHYDRTEEKRAREIFEEARARWDAVVNYFRDRGATRFAAWQQARERNPDLLVQYRLADENRRAVQQRVQAEIEAYKAEKIRDRAREIRSK
jgi:hypothetical protein